VRASSPRWRDLLLHLRRRAKLTDAAGAGGPNLPVGMGVDVYGGAQAGGEGEEEVLDNGSGLMGGTGGGAWGSRRVGGVPGGTREGVGEGVDGGARARPCH
jgi:hypothetical protein